MSVTVLYLEGPLFSGHSVVPHRIIRSWYTSCWWWAATFGTARRGGGARAACGPARSHPRCIKCNSPPSTASVRIIVLLYDGPLLYGFNAAIKGLTRVARPLIGYFYILSPQAMRSGS